MMKTTGTQDKIIEITEAMRDLLLYKFKDVKEESYLL